MTPRKHTLKSGMKNSAYKREEDGMTRGVTLEISESLDRRLVAITLNVREQVLIGVEKVVFS